MAYNFNNNGANYLNLGSAPVTAMPLTMAAWIRPDQNTALDTVIHLGDASDGDDRGWRMNMAGATAGDPIQATQENDSGTGSAAATTTGITTNQWHHICGVYTSTTSRNAYIDGGSVGSDTTSIAAPSAIDRLIVGRRIQVTNATPYGGDLCEMAVWNVALTADEVAALGRGYSPLFIRPASLVGYWPLIRDTNPRKGPTAFSIVGSLTVVPHPRIIQPRRSLWVPKVIAGGIKSPPLYTNAQSFFAPSVKKNEIPKPTALTNSSTFHAPRIRLTTKPAALSNAQTFQTPTLRHTYKPTALTNASIHYAPNVAVDITVAPAHLASGNSFASPTIRLTLKPAAFSDGDTFYAPTVVADVGDAIAPPHYTNDQVFQSPTIRLSVSAPALASAAVIYGPSLRLTLQPSAYANGQTFQAPRIALTLRPTSLVNAPVFQSPRISLRVSAAAYANAQAFYDATLLLDGNVLAPLYVNTNQCYGPTVTRSSVGVGDYGEPSGGRRRKKRRVFPPYEEVDLSAPPPQAPPAERKRPRTEGETRSAALIANALLERTDDAPRVKPVLRKIVPDIDPAAFERVEAQRQWAEQLAVAEALLAQGVDIAARAHLLTQAETLEGEFHVARRKREAEEERLILLAAMEMLF